MPDMFKVECPRCRRIMQVKQLEELRTFPFCSERCRLIDLGVWLEGGYGIPGQELSPDDLESPPTKESGDKKST